MNSVLCALILAFSVLLSMPIMAKDGEPLDKLLITNVNIFDGEGEGLAPGMSVLVEGNKIATIAKSIPAPGGATVIDGGGRTLTPGFIDAHVHLSLQVNYAELLLLDEYYFAFSKPEENFALIMKDGKIYKNTIR